MMKRRQSREIAGAVSALLLGAALAGCGSPAGVPAPSAAASAPADATPTSTASVGSTGPAPGAGSWSGDACGLLTGQDVATVFPDAAPEPEAKSYGAGFAECRWEEGDRRLRVAVLPFAELTEDYVKKLNVAGPVAGLGSGAVWFPGVVSIGSGSSRGATVGFRAGDHGVLVAVRSAKDSKAEDDLARATELGRLLPDRLG